MYRLLLVACFVSLVCGGTTLPGHEEKIIGGSNAISGQFPYQVSLRTSGNAHFCGGSIVNNRWIVTTASCTVGRTTANTVLVVGTHLRLGGGVSHNSIRIVNHPNYNATRMDNDVSCVQSGTNFVFTNLVRAIPLGATSIGGNVSAIVSGWGQVANPGVLPNNLQYATLQTIALDVCRRQHLPVDAAKVHDSTICTYTRVGQGICMGDIGGPLVANGTLIGLVSWGKPCAIGSPDVFTRVSTHRSWIVSVTG